MLNRFAQTAADDSFWLEPLLTNMREVSDGLYILFIFYLHVIFSGIWVIVLLVVL